MFRKAVRGNRLQMADICLNGVPGIEPTAVDAKLSQSWYPQKLIKVNTWLIYWRERKHGKCTK